MSAPASPLLRHTTTMAVIVVGSIAAIVSYSHMRNLGVTAGENWRAWLIPVSIDGLIVAASMVLVTRRRAQLPTSALAWGALAAGVIASLAANMADAAGSLTSVLYAGWAPVALAVGFELLLQQRRAEAPVAVTPVVEPYAVVVDTPAPAPHPIGGLSEKSEGYPAPSHLEVQRDPSRPLQVAAEPITKTPLRLVSPPARRSPVRAAAVAHLTNLTPAARAAITPAQLAAAIGAKTDTCRRGLAQWRLDAAANSERAVGS